MRHEQAAAHAADAYARLTRNVGVAVVTAGPGVTDAVTGVANAYAARSPLLLIGGAAPLGAARAGRAAGDGAGDLLRPITKGAWTVAETRADPRGAHHRDPRRAVGRGRARCSSRCRSTADRQRSRTGWRRSRPATRTGARRPADPAAIERLAALLAARRAAGGDGGQRRLLGRRGDALRAFVEAAGMPVFMNGAGRGCLPSDHPLAFAQARKLGAGPGRRACSCWARRSTSASATARQPTFAEDAKVVQVDRDPAELGRNRPLERRHRRRHRRDPRAARARRCRRPEPRATPAWRAELRRARSSRRATELEAAERVRRMRPIIALPLGARRSRAAVDAATRSSSATAATCVGCASKSCACTGPGQWLDPGPLGCLGVGPSFAIAAKLLHPEQQRAADRGRRRLRPQRHGDRDGACASGLPIDRASSATTPAGGRSATRSCRSSARSARSATSLPRPATT